MSNYKNGAGNVPRLPDAVVDTLLNSAGVSDYTPNGSQLAQLRALVHSACEELLARLPSSEPVDDWKERGRTLVAELADNGKTYSYEIAPRADYMGGGWSLHLWADGEEAGGGVFPVVADEAAGIAWWNGLREEERAWHLQQCAPALPTAANAYRAHLLVEAYNEAEAAATDWLESRPT